MKDPISSFTVGRSEKLKKKNERKFRSNLEKLQKESRDREEETSIHAN